MKVLAEEPWSWALYEDGDRQVLSVLKGGVGIYEVKIELLPREREAWAQSGVEGLYPLIEAIQRNHRQAIAERAQERFSLALSDFLLPGADPVALTERWRPDRGACALVFSNEIWKSAQSAYEVLWAEAEVLRPEQGSDRVRMDVATTETLAAGNLHFPGGWETIAKKALNPGLAIARWRFGLPSGHFGAAYDGLIDLGDRLVWFPKPYRVLRGILQGQGA